VSERPRTTPAISSRMSRQARRDTAPEVALRRELHRRGLRFRVDWPIPGMPRRRADIAFTRKRVAIFIDGCFWHRCPTHKTAPANNAAWWTSKLEMNVRRDRETDEHLAATGWIVLRFWEHDALDDVVRMTVAALSQARHDHDVDADGTAPAR
jgi:DNA mismatch endonuclease, patch repair protein